MEIKRVMLTHFFGVAPDGASLALIMGDPTGNRYYVKTRDNEQGCQVLVNELVTGAIGHLMRLAVPEVAVGTIPRNLVKHSVELRSAHKRPVGHGKHFASALVYRIEEEVSPARFRKYIEGSSAAIRAIPGLIILNMLVRNYDGDRYDHFLFTPTDKPTNGYIMTGIDHGSAFIVPRWGKRIVLAAGHWNACIPSEFNSYVRGNRPFDEALAALSILTDEEIESIVDQVPPCWGMRRRNSIRLKHYLRLQRDAVPEILAAHRHRFPLWKDQAVA